MAGLKTWDEHFTSVYNEELATLYDYDGLYTAMKNKTSFILLPNKLKGVFLMRNIYISRNQLKKYWDTTPICIEFLDGTDALAQENGYTLEQCLNMSDVKFFLDIETKKYAM